MFCPKCGDVMAQVNGELTCVRGGMGLSRRMEGALVACYGEKSRKPVGLRSPLRWGGDWFCPGCGVRAMEVGGMVNCPVCGLCMNEFLCGLVELHPHDGW